jgi:hypothetical protein
LKRFILFNYDIKNCNIISPPMRPLQLVNPVDLIPGKTYLIREKRPEYAHLNCKGTFVKNDYPQHPSQCTITHFTNVICRNNQSSLDLGLPDAYWNYYEADAVIRAYTNHVLRQITGDPSFVAYSPTI